MGFKKNINSVKVLYHQQTHRKGKHGNGNIYYVIKTYTFDSDVVPPTGLVTSV